MDTTRLKYLLRRHITHVISASESEELSTLLQKVEPKIQEKLLAEILEETAYGEDLDEHRKQVVYNKIISRVFANQSETDTTTPFRQRRFFKKYAAIAAILLMGLSLTGLLLWTTNESPKSIEINLTTTDVDDIYLTPDSLPFLSLPDGYTRLLKEEQDNALTDVGIKLIREESGEMVYAVQHQVVAGDMQEKKMIFSTPKGHSHKVLLADGTQVWLNSGSSLEYPVAFSATERRVKLIGEGYFDVATDKEIPFYVETNNGPVIEVLGTAFNVSAYQEENTTTTTLVEGSVRLLGEKQTMVLKPNEQVMAHAHESSWKTYAVNVEDFISWKEGYFSFHAHAIEDILTTVQRWYHIENIEYKHWSNEKFTGTFKRTKSLKSLLTKLEKISDLKFDIKERRVIVLE